MHEDARDGRICWRQTIAGTSSAGKTVSAKHDWGFRPESGCHAYVSSAVRILARQLERPCLQAARFRGQQELAVGPFGSGTATRSSNQRNIQA